MNCSDVVGAVVRTSTFVHLSVTFGTITVCLTSGLVAAAIDAYVAGAFGATNEVRCKGKTWITNNSSGKALRAEAEVTDVD